MLSSITDVAAVRTRGALGSGDEAGGATTAQIEAAIALASDEIAELVTPAAYKATRDYGEDATDVQKVQQEAFELAESYLTLAWLPQVLQNQRLAATGIQSSVTMGQTTVQLASSQDAKDMSDGWRNLALRKLAPYIPNAVEEDDDDEDTGVESDTFSMIAI
jgi:hypothetical protein